MYYQQRSRAWQGHSSLDPPVADKHSIGKQLMGCVMECGADREEKNREATSKSKTNARLVRGQGKVSSLWGWRRRKGCKCTDSNPHLHF